MEKIKEFRPETGWLKKQIDSACDWKDSYSWYQVIEILDLVSMKLDNKEILFKIEEVRNKAVKKMKHAEWIEGVTLVQFDRLKG